MTCIHFKTLLLTLAPLLTVASAAYADFDAQFADCTKKTGEAYVTARDELLKSATAAQLNAKKESKSGAERLTALILLGWKDHDKEYRELIAGPRTTDQLGNEHLKALLMLSELKNEQAPLLFEIMIKDVQPPSVAQDACDALAFLAQHKNLEVDSKALFDVCAGSDGTDAMFARMAKLVCALPDEDILASDYFLDTLRKVEQRPGSNTATIGYLLQGLSRSAAALTPDEKDKLTKDLLADEKLSKNVDRIKLMHAVGNIGGDVAARKVSEYLDATQVNVEKHWALEALANSGSEEASKPILRYVKSDSVPGSLRSIAIRGLGKVPYTEDVGKALTEVVTDKKGLEDDRIRAVKSLDLLQQRNLNNPKLKEQLESISNTDLGNQALSRHIQLLQDKK